MATASQRIDKLEQGMDAILSLLTAQAEVKDDTPDTATVKAGRKSNATNKAESTARKSGTITRNLDPVDVDTESDAFPTMRVIASNASGPLFNGARILPVDANGREQRSWPLPALVAAAEVMPEIAAAVDTVEKRAKIGAHVQKPSRAK